jgi:molecular chaperone DnaK
MREIIIGIDLGTTNSAVAYVKEGVPQIIPVDGQPTMPSCVALDPTGKLIVGAAARNMLVAAPESTVLSVKRLMGQNTKLTLGERSYSPEEISSFILRRLKEEAEAHLGVPVHKAVITVPAFFDESQRKATKDAGSLAGLEVVRIINEPTAAALAYSVGSKEVERVLVYDLGGGTFDVSVVLIENGVVEVKASRGDTHLGGDDFDLLLVDQVKKVFLEKEGQALEGDLKTSRRLKVALERAKCLLSDSPYTKVEEEYIQQDRHLQLEVQRETFEEVVAPLLQKTLECVQQSLKDADISAGGLSKVLLVGGATRSPVVHRLLQGFLGQEPRSEVNPDLIVALGAGICAASFAGEETHPILVDIAAHTLSLGVLHDSSLGPEIRCSPVLRRNVPLPATKSELYWTVFDNQESVQIEVYEGESNFPGDNTLVGSFRITGLAKVPEGNPVLVTLNLDLSGLLKVTAMEKMTGLSKTVTMDIHEKGGSFDVESARANIQGLFENEPTDASEEDVTAQKQASSESEASGGQIDKQLLAEAKDLRQRAEALLAGTLSPEDATDVREHLHQSTEAIKIGDRQKLREHTDALSDLVFYLED